MTIVLFSACTGGGATGEESDQSRGLSAALEGTVWQIEDIDRGGIIDDSMIILAFPAAGQLSGFTGCNRYSGTVKVVGQRLTVEDLASSQRGCAPALMQQEQRFLNALEASASFKLAKGGQLIVSDANGRVRLTGISTVADPTAPAPEQAGPASGMTRVFDCADHGLVGATLVDSENLQLTVRNAAHALVRERSASGERYVGDRLSFWSKGDEAVLVLGDTRFPCDRRMP